MSKRTLRIGGAVALAVHVLAGAGDAGAQQADAWAERRSTQLDAAGIQAVRDGGYGLALGLFRKSYALVARPATLWNIVGAEIELGENAAAHRDLEAYLALSDRLSPEDRTEAAELLRDLRARLASVEIVVSAPGASVTADGVPVEGSGGKWVVWLDPGEHVLRAEARGRSPAEKRLVLKKGDRAKEELAPPRPREPDPDPRQRVVGLAIVGVGLSGLVVGGNLLGFAVEKSDAMRALCAQEGCRDQYALSAYQALQRDARSLAHGVNLALTLGAAVSVVGVSVMLVPGSGGIRPPASRTREIAVSLAPIQQGSVVLLGGEW